MKTTFDARLLAASLAGPAFFSACAALERADPPLRAPRDAIEAHVHAGTFLTGPLPRAAQSADTAPLAIRHWAWWVEQPVPAGTDLASAAEVVLGPADADPLRPIARRAGAVGVARGAQASALESALVAGLHGRIARAWDERAGLPAGATFRLRNEPARDSGSPALVLDASRASTAHEVRLGVQIGLRGDDAREAVLLAAPLRAGDGPVALVLARAAGRDEPATLVAFVEAVEDVGIGAATALLDESAARASERRRDVTRPEEERREIAAILAGLADEEERRARLLFLAGICGAPLALDVALVAADDDLARFADAVRRALPEPADRAGAAWPLERAAWTTLGKLATDGAIAPELAGILARQGGEAARFAGAIDDLVRGAGSVTELHARLAAENRILLEDAAPAARSRAFDWLAARGLAPAGYDPFGPLRERRAALAADEESRERAAEAPR